MSFKEWDFNKKIKLGVAILAIVLVIIVMSVGYIFFSRLQSPNTNSISKPTNQEQNVVDKNNTDKENKDDTKKKDDVVSKSNPKEAKIIDDNKDALSENTDNATPVQQLFYSSFGGKIEYPIISNDPEKNIIKIYTVYMLENLENMKKLEDDVFSNKVDKVTYYNALETMDNTSKSLVGNSDKIISLCEDSKNKEEAQKLSDLISTIYGLGNNEYQIITQTPSFGKAMIKDLPFGAALDENIKTLKDINESLGCDDQKALDTWSEYSKKNLDFYFS